MADNPKQSANVEMGKKTKGGPSKCNFFQDQLYWSNNKFECKNYIKNISFIFSVKSSSSKKVGKESAKRKAAEGFGKFPFFQTLHESVRRRNSLNYLNYCSTTR